MSVYSQIQYPREARDKGEGGQVLISWTVDPEGRVRKIRLERDPGSGMGKEVLRVFKEMSKQVRWQPGQHNGQPVAVRLVAPITFRVEG